jgi:hypothetical protein
MRERICLRAVADRSPARALDVCARGDVQVRASFRRKLLTRRFRSAAAFFVRRVVTASGHLEARE